MLDADLGDLGVQRRRQQAERHVACLDQRLELRRIADLELNAASAVTSELKTRDEIVGRERHVNVRTRGKCVNRRPCQG